MSDAVRTATLAEVKALSLASIRKVLKDKASADKFLDKLSGKNPSIAEVEKLFVTVGMAKSIRIDEDWGTQPYYGIGSPTRPVLVPNNYSVSMSIDRLQLDGKNNFSYITSPDYWYSKHVQRRSGASDWPMYTYIYIHDREAAAKNKDKGRGSVEMYAMMPRTASKAVSAQDVMIVHSIQMVGFKYQYLDLIGDIMGASTALRDNSGILGYGRTIIDDGASEQTFGSVVGTPEGQDRAAAGNNAGGR